MNRIFKATLAIALAALTTASYGAIRANFTGPASWNSWVAPVYVPLRADGSTKVTFNLPAAGKKILTYSAACYSLSAYPDEYYVHLDIYVNGVVVAPTGGLYDPFCGSNAAWQHPSITLVFPGKEGTNSVQILAKFFGAGNVSLRSSSLVIHD